MNGYFSRLIQQTGINLGEQNSNKVNLPDPGESRIADLPNHPARPESLEVEEIVEVTAPAGQATPDHHEIVAKADREQQNIGVDVKEVVKQEPSRPLKHRDQNNVKTSITSHAHPTKQVSQQESSIQDTLVKADNEIKPTSPKESSPAKLRSTIEHSVITEKADSPSPASIEQHVYISQLPDSYQQAIKDWLTSPADGSKGQPGNQEKLKKAIKGKQNSKVILKSEQMKGDDLPVIQVENEQFEPGDLHLSVGNINLTIEEPETAKQQAPQTPSKPARRQPSGSSRLSRHYVRVR